MWLAVVESVVFFLWIFGLGFIKERSKCQTDNRTLISPPVVVGMMDLGMVDGDMFTTRTQDSEYLSGVEDNNGGKALSSL